MNLPNKLTILRIVMIPVFMAFFFLTMIPYNYFIAAIVFVLAAATDFLDGYIARKYHLVTNLGKFLDPIAEKFWSPPRSSSCSRWMRSCRRSFPSRSR